jgi:hypothetical protein
MLKLIFATAAVLGMFMGGPADKVTGKKTDPGVTTDAACPLIYAPVICDHGKIYPNQCEADQHHATNCVPYGI